MIFGARRLRCVDCPEAQAPQTAKYNVKERNQQRETPFRFKKRS